MSAQASNEGKGWTTHDNHVETYCTDKTITVLMTDHMAKKKNHETIGGGVFDSTKIELYGLMGASNDLKSREGSREAVREGAWRSKEWTGRVLVVLVFEVRNDVTRKDNQRNCNEVGLYCVGTGKNTVSVRLRIWSRLRVGLSLL